MANGDIVLDTHNLRLTKMLDADAGNTTGPWVYMSPYTQNPTVHVKGASGWDGFVEIYGTNDADEAGNGVKLGDNGVAGADAIIPVTPCLKTRAIVTLRTAGNTTCRLHANRN